MESSAKKAVHLPSQLPSLANGLLFSIESLLILRSRLFVNLAAPSSWSTLGIACRARTRNFEIPGLAEIRIFALSTIVYEKPTVAGFDRKAVGFPPQ
jgi:hypothetical protein